VLGQGSGASLGKLLFRTFDEKETGRINAQALLPCNEQRAGIIVVQRATRRHYCRATSNAQALLPCNEQRAGVIAVQRATRRHYCRATSNAGVIAVQRARCRHGCRAMIDKARMRVTGDTANRRLNARRPAECPLRR
jgi:hypothetical protein